MFETEQVTDETNTQDVTSESSDASPGASPEQQDGAAQSLVDLDSVQKFRFEGKEWTPKDFRSAYMMQADYTRKTQALAEERRYYDNLQADLAAVKANPALASKFRSVYPQKFHGFLDYASPAQAAAQAANQAGAAQPQGADPALLARIEAMERVNQQRESAAIDAEINATFETLSKKYPLADESSVIAKAEALLSHARDQGDQDFKLDAKTWDRIWKADQERQESRYKAHYSKQVQNQTAANRKGKDAATGGGIPGQAPKTPRTIKAATQALMDAEQL